MSLTNYKAIIYNKLKVLFFLSLGILTLLALVTYNANDPSVNVVSDQIYKNILKNYGAIIADLLYQFSGITALLIPITFIAWAINMLKKHEITFFKTKVLMLLLCIIFFTLPFANTNYINLPSNDGGLIGILLYNILSKYNIFNEYYYIMHIIFIKVASTLFLSVIGITPSTYYHVIKRLLCYLISLFKINKDTVINLKENKHNIVINETALNNDKASYKSKIINNKNVIKEQNSILPPISLLKSSSKQNIKLDSQNDLKSNAEELLKVLNDFGVKGNIIDIKQGPVVTLYEFEPAAGIKSSRVIGLCDDIARSLCALSTRIANIPGRNVLGIELPNKQRAFFNLRELIETDEYNNKSINLPLVLGKDLAGAPFIVDLAKMPHLLVAGTTGSGKSVAINAMIISLLYRYTPEECKMIMIDPKMLELSVYDNIPHLLTPVVTDPKKAITALKWAVAEMEERYRLMSNLGVRNIQGYNDKITESIASGKKLSRTAQTGFDKDTGSPIYESIAIANEKLPFIVVIVDEMADLMLVAGKDIESSIQRLAQMARAAGIHIIMATQRPSVDVITGVIKANFPSRISFKVTSKIDSRTILGEQGAEQLLGMGDMLYMGGTSKILRLHAPFVDDMEVQEIADFLRNSGSPSYVDAVTYQNDSDNNLDLEYIKDGNDDATLYKKALYIVKTERKVSISYIQRSLRIGYNRAADIIEKMEKEGIISSPSMSGKREILIPE